MDALAYIIPPLSVLAGVVVTELFNTWKRREKLFSLVFEKKFECYSQLCGMNANLAGKVIQAKTDKIEFVSVIEASDEIIRFMQEHYLIISVPVRNLVSDIRQSIGNTVYIKTLEPVYPDDVITLNNRLAEQCKKELGLDTFINAFKEN